MQNYSLLERRMEKISAISRARQLLQWDCAVNMPPRAADSRSNEIAVLSSLMHDMLVSNETSELISAVEVDGDTLDMWQSANLREIKRSFIHASCVNTDLMTRYALASSRCEFIWRLARSNNDYEALKPSLAVVLDIVKDIAAAKSEKLGVSKYDALIDQYDPGRKSVDIERIYSVLREKLPSLIHNIMEKQAVEKVLHIPPMDTQTQRTISRKFVEIMGFDFNAGRLDESTHPFCGGTPYDIRMTSRYYEDNFISGLMSSVHEAGHGLYVLNLPEKYKGQPVGDVKGMAFHESQSLIMEMQIGRSREFADLLSRILYDHFGMKGPEYSGANLYKLITWVKPDFIRIDADEITYPLHVILRFEMEMDLINDRVQLDDLPELWNLKMHQYLGIKPPSNMVGCMQDVHWPSGAFGYFPSYTIGAIIAAAMMKRATNANPDILSAITRGDFSGINSFLNSNFRNFGSMKESSDLLMSATGFGVLNPMVFLNYLSQKYDLETRFDESISYV